MRTALNLYGVAVANERETKRWNHDRWVGVWPDRERLTEALSPFLLEAVDARPASGCATSAAAAAS